MTTTVDDTRPDLDDTGPDLDEDGVDDEDDSLVEHAPTVPLSAVFRRFWPYTRDFRGRMVLSLLLTGAVPALSTASIYLYKVLIDDVLTPHDFGPFPLVAGLYLAITVVQGVVTWVDEFLTAWVGERFVLNLRVELFTHLQRLSMNFFERRQLGDIMSRLGGDVSEIETLVLTGVNMALTYAFQIVLFTGMLIYLDWRLALAALVAAPGFLVIARVLSRRIQAAARELRRRSGSISAVAEESLSNLALVQAYDRQADETARYHRENQGAFRAQMVAVRVEGLFGPLSSLVEVIGVLVVMGFAVWELASGRLTLGELLVFVAYISQLYGPVGGFGGLWNEMSSAKAGAERIIEMLDEEPAVTDPADPAPLGRAAGAVAVHGLTFAYPDTERPALAGVDLWIAPGEKVAVVGASGAGKTTLTKLLLRFYDPDAGQITLDGRDIRALSLSDLRRNVGAVLQETLVFDGTIADNIRWGRPDATDEEIEQAARAADVHRFVTELPDGYATRVGQRGRLLSGGQRQRLAIARAMIRNAPVLVLDEPTTGLDAESTERVLGPLRRLMAGRTTLMISHNLLTVSDADRILYLEDGRVSAVGSHRELLVHSPGYARLYRLHQPEAPAAPTPFRRVRDSAAGMPAGVVAPPRPMPVPVPAGAALFESGAAETATVRMRLPLVAAGPRKGPRHLRDAPPMSLRPSGPRPGGRHRAPEPPPAPTGPDAPRPDAAGPDTAGPDAAPPRGFPLPAQRPLAPAGRIGSGDAPHLDAPPYDAPHLDPRLHDQRLHDQRLHESLTHDPLQHEAPPHDAPHHDALPHESPLLNALFLDPSASDDPSAGAESAAQRPPAIR